MENLSASFWLHKQRNLLVLGLVSVSTSRRTSPGRYSATTLLRCLHVLPKKFAYMINVDFHHLHLALILTLNTDMILRRPIMPYGENEL